MKENPPTSASSAHTEERHTSFRLASSRWLGGPRELARGGMVLFFITLIGHSLLMCECGAVPGAIMALSALLPLIFGSRSQRIVAAFCLVVAIYFAYSGFKRTSAMRERLDRTRQLHEQRLQSR